MLPGFSGHLISEFFLERCGADAPAGHAQGAPAERVRRELAAWRTRCRGLGPASFPGMVEMNGGVAAPDYYITAIRGQILWVKSGETLAAVPKIPPADKPNFVMQAVNRSETY